MSRTCTVKLHVSAPVPVPVVALVPGSPYITVVRPAGKNAPAAGAVFGRIWSYMVVYGRIWSCLVVFGRVWSYLVVFGRIWSYLVVFGRILC